MPQQTTLGTDFAHAFLERDPGRVRSLLHPEIDFRGLTPSRVWEASGQDAVLDVLFGNWLEESDHVESVGPVESDTVVDRERVGYRFRATTPDGHFVVEQQAYLSTSDGRIDWMRVICSGFRPAP